ncbi:MAG: carbohydrate ABC transporter permease [Streptococcaceae bacterium]|jgi:multiple sugar transport system permease protein|nr:carbohydrate ABC transporter permease [Streptococcaceae bacterium]
MASFQGTKINPSRFDKSQLKFYAVLIPVAIFMGLPIVYIFMTAFKPLDELFAFPPRFFVQKPTTQNFQQLFANSATSSTPVSRYLFNSIMVSLVVVVATVVVGSLAAYVLSKKNFKGKYALMEINNVALMFVSTAVAIPSFFVITKIGILNTPLAHILPLLALPVGLFLIKQFVDQIPDSLIEAARIDGASEFRIYWRVVLPMIAPALATVAVLAFQASWNNVQTSNLYINSDSLKTFAFYMSTLTAASSGNTVAGQGMAAAASLIMFLPNLIVFIFMQSRVMDTMANSGLK